MRSLWLVRYTLHGSILADASSEASVAYMKVNGQRNFISLNVVPWEREQSSTDRELLPLVYAVEALPLRVCPKFLVQCGNQAL